MLEYTTKIVSAFLVKNRVAIDEIPAFIRSTYAALLATDSADSLPSERQMPAIALKKSVTPSAIICLECGKRQAMLKRHLYAAHGLSTDAYRSKWLLPAGYPMVAPEYAARRSILAMKIGLGRSPKA